MSVKTEAEKILFFYLLSDLVSIVISYLKDNNFVINMPKCYDSECIPNERDCVKDIVVRTFMYSCVVISIVALSI